jgi:hypothetical protein
MPGPNGQEVGFHMPSPLLIVGVIEQREGELPRVVGILESHSEKRERTEGECQTKENLRDNEREVNAEDDVGMARGMGP